MKTFIHYQISFSKLFLPFSLSYLNYQNWCKTKPSFDYSSIFISKLAACESIYGNTDSLNHSCSCQLLPNLQYLTHTTFVSFEIINLPLWLTIGSHFCFPSSICFCQRHTGETLSVLTKTNSRNCSVVRSFRY